MFERYVFIELPGLDQPVAAGFFALDTDLGVGRFSYGRRYLLRKEAVPLDPVNLPLSEQEYITSNNNGIFFVLADLFPDSWGKYILSKKLDIPFGSLKPHEYFDLVANTSVGAVSISRSLERDSEKSETLLSFDDIDKVITAFDSITSNRNLPAEVLHVLEQGTSLGGAQPKCPLLYNGEEWVAKFKNNKIPVNLPTIEYAAMTLAEKCGITIPEIALEEAAGDKIYLIKRFDRKEGKRIPFISGHALSSLEIDKLEMGSYLMLAGFVRQISKTASKELSELFRRMVFNIAIGNSDDHLRNHGWIYSPEENWRLSPAYDILPIPRRAKDFSLSLIAGDQGTRATYENALSQCKKFNLTRMEAEEIIADVTEKVRGWRGHFVDCGVSDRDINEIRFCFMW